MALIWVVLLIMVLLFTLEWHKIPLVKYYAAQTRNLSIGDSSLLEARIYVTNSFCIKSVRGNGALAFNLLLLWLCMKMTLLVTNCVPEKFV